MKIPSAKVILQKYGKIIMTIMSVLLMVVFALPTFSGGKPTDGATQAFGHLEGKTITVDNMTGERMELAAIDNLQLFDVFSNTGAVMRLMAPEESDRPQYWFVLRTEASKYASVVLGEDEAFQFLTRVTGASSETLNERLDRYSMTHRSLARVLSDLQTVETYLRFALTQPRPVTALELLADRNLRKVQVNFAALDATEGWPQSSAPTPEQIQTQFNAYKSVVPTPILTASHAPYLLGVQLDPNAAPDSRYPFVAIVGFPEDVKNAARVRVGDTLPWDGSKVNAIYGGSASSNTPALITLSGGGRPQPYLVYPGMDLHQQSLPALPQEVNSRHLPFGYKYPDRVSVQYLVFNREEIRKIVPVTLDIVQDAHKAFDAANPRTATTSAPATVPASQEAAGVTVAPPTATQTAPAPVTWDSEKDKYVKKEVDKQLDRLMRKMVDWVRSRTEAPFRNTDWKDNPPPPSKDWVDYAKVAEDFARVGDYNKYQPLVKDTGKTFLSARQLEEITGIGHAINCSSQGQIFPFSVLATNVGELVTPDKQAPSTLRNMHVGFEAPEVTDKDGNVYLFRVTAVDKAHEPASLDEDKAGVPDPAIRQQVTDDCRKLAAFNLRAKEIKDILAKGNAGGGVDAVATQFKVAVQKTPDFNRIESNAPMEIQGIHDFVKTAFTLHDPKTATGMGNLEEDATLKCFPMELLSSIPATAAEFDKNLGNLISVLREQDPAVEVFIRSYLEVKAIAARVKYEPQGGWPKPKAP